VTCHSSWDEVTSHPAAGGETSCLKLGVIIVPVEHSKTILSVHEYVIYDTLTKS
jgi:hypothetical protein